MQFKGESQVGTDRIEAYGGVCVCGTGEVKINFCTPDHPWPTKSKWFETSVTCDSCRAEYDLVEQNNQFVFVRKSDVRKQQALWSEYSRRSDNILKAVETRKLLNDLEALLDRQPSMAACHRLLRAHNLEYESYATFRKRWNGGGDWVSRYVRASNLDKVLELLGKKDPTISNELSGLDALWEQHKAPLPVVGNPLLNTSPYRE
jgi:hypothetical protein